MTHQNADELAVLPERDLWLPIVSGKTLRLGREREVLEADSKTWDLVLHDYIAHLAMSDRAELAFAILSPLVGATDTNVSQLNKISHARANREQLMVGLDHNRFPEHKLLGLLS